MALPAKVPVRLGPLFSFNVNLLTAIERETAFHTVCDNGHLPARVQAPRVCPTCGNRDTSTFKSGREVDGQLVVVDPTQLRQSVPPPPRELVVTAHPLRQVMAHTLPSGSVYLLAPSDQASAAGYAVLRHVLLANPDLALVVEFGVHTASRMWRIGLYEEALTLAELAWPETVRERPAIPDVVVADNVMAVANTLLQGLATDFDPTAYRDTAKAAREELVAAALAEAPPRQPLPAKVPSNVSTSLLEALQASVAAVTSAAGKSGKSGKAATVGTAGKATPAKRAAPAKRAPAAKVAAPAKRAAPAKAAGGQPRRSRSA